MFRSSCSPALWLLLALPIISNAAPTTITVQGVVNEAVYTDQTAFTVVTQPGLQYQATLNGNPVPTGTAVPVTRPDFYELHVTGTPDGGGSTIELDLLFIVRSSERGTSELGLPAHVPLPVVNSSTTEFAGGQLRLLAPAEFPSGIPVPLAAFVEDASGHPLRVNGLLHAPGYAGIQLRRGAGSGFLPPSLPAGPATYNPTLPGLAASKTIQIEASTVWTPASGTLSGNLTWPANSRINVTGDLAIPAGSSLTIGEGTVVLLNDGAGITLNGTLTINGTRNRPVVFTPASPAQPWGGFLLRSSTSELIATATLFTGSGKDQNWIPDNGYGSHRDEECLFFLESTPSLTLTDCAMFDLAGQWGHSINGGSLTLSHCLLQRCTTGGEFTGASFKVNNSAFIECPADTPLFADGDNDGLYITSGTHGFTNTLFGWTKDDAIDAGGSGSGTLHFEACWFEALFHEGIAGSGNNKVINLYNSVFLNSGQAYESGYDSPFITAIHCLSINNLSGARFGDNYASGSLGTKTGFLRVTNSIVIHNHRDILGRTWDTWDYRYANMDIVNNHLTTASSDHPANLAWNPGTDASLLAPFQAADISTVGAAFAAWPGNVTLEDFAGGLPVALSSFTTNEVQIGYRLECTEGICADGTLVFAPGEMLKRIALPAFVGVLRCTLQNPIQAELTGASQITLQNLAPLLGENTTLVAQRSVWNYLDDGSDQGSAWTTNGFDDSGWLSGPAELGYGDGDEATEVRSERANGTGIITTYYRREFDVGDPAAFGELTLRFRRDDGGVVYINGAEVFRSNMPGGVIRFDTTAAGTTPNGQENDFRTTTTNATVLRAGNNVIAAEVHQVDTGSSDTSFEIELVAGPASSGSTLHLARLGPDLVAYWADPASILEEADSITGSWNTSPTGNAEPFAPSSGPRFFRLRD